MRHFVICLSVLLFFSCEKNKPLREREEQRQQAINGCKNSIFVGDVLNKKNVLNFFECLGWDKELGSLYNELSILPERDWDIFVRPFNNTFFESKNYEIRERLFSFFYLLEKDGSL